MRKIISFLTCAAIILSMCAVPISSSAAANPSFTVFMTEKTGEMRHGSAGFLYGLGSYGTPKASLLTPLKPGTAVQKAPDGMQHPTGDVLDVAETFINAGGEAVQIYLQDIFALWPYEYTTFDDYLARIGDMVPKIVELRKSNPAFSGKLVYVPFNEPDGIWYGNIDSDVNVQNTFNQNWKAAYDLIHSLDPDALIGGVSYATYRPRAMDSWIKFVTENSCEPDYITWHELQTDKLSSFKQHLESYRSIEAKYGMDKREIIINEYAPQNDCSVPGKLVNWIALFEENKVSGCLPYWHNAGNLNDIAADNNEPNGAWWLYKWYGDMSGETLKVQTSTQRSELYGLASIDDNKRSANVLFGGIDGNCDVILSDIDKTLPFSGAEAVDIKVEATYWTAFHGSAPEPSVVMTGTYPVEDGSVTVSMPDMEASAAYNITVTEASDPSRAGICYYGAFRKTYEAEDALYIGSVYQNSDPWTYAYSEGARLSGIMGEGDGYNMVFSVPQEGYYRCDITYGNGYGLNTANPSENAPKTLKETLRFDGGDEEVIDLENTLRDQMGGMYTEYVYLTAGSHTLYVRGHADNGGAFSNDSVSFTYCGMEIPVFNSLYEAELSDFNILLENTDTTLTTESALPGYSASGYVTGLSKRGVPDGGGARFTVNVPDNGLYSLTLYYSSERENRANIYLGNTALELDNLLTTVDLSKTDGFEKTSVTAFFEKGINVIDIDFESEAAFDALRVRKSEADKTITVQAEDGAISGNAETDENPYSSGSFVKNIEGGTSDALEITADAPEGGSYKMAVRYSVSELFGAHDYNAQIVDRYATFSVNGNEGETVYFKNSFSDENWRTAVLDVTLQKGENRIKVYNDNHRTIRCGVSKNGGIEYQTLVNYAPNIDFIQLTPSLAEGGEDEEAYSLSAFTTDGGLVLLDKNLVSAGDEVNITFMPEYENGNIEVVANGEDISKLISENSLTYVPKADTVFYVRFIKPENLDRAIENSSFGAGSLSGWTYENAEVVTEGENHFAKIGSISQNIEAEDGYYDIVFLAKGESLTASAGETALEIPVTGEWKRYSVRAKAEGGIIPLSLEGDADVDSFELSDDVDKNLLYFVNAGDADPTTLSEGDKYGTMNSVTEQFFGKDAATGFSWGIDDEPAPNDKYPDILTGRDTWPYEYDLTDGLDKTVSYRYAKDQNDKTGAGVTYKFELPDGEYAFEVGFYAPSDWMANVNRKGTVRVNGEAIVSGVIPRSDAKNPIIAKAVAEVSGGYATLNLKLDSDGAGGPMISYIKISKAAEEPEMKLMNSALMTITGSATWENHTDTVAKYAFDGRTDTFFDGISGGWCIADLGSETEIAAIGFVPRENWEERMTATAFYASNDGAEWTKLFVIPTTPEAGRETIVTSPSFLETGRFRYVKYQNTYDYCNVAEIKIYKKSGEISFANLTDGFTLTKIEESADGLGYNIEFEGSVSATLVQSVKDGAALKSVKLVPLAKSPIYVPKIDENEELFIWDIKKMKPLVIIEKG